EGLRHRDGVTRICPFSTCKRKVSRKILGRPSQSPGREPLLAHGSQQTNPTIHKRGLTSRPLQPEQVSPARTPRSWPSCPNERAAGPVPSPRDRMTQGQLTFLSLALDWRFP